METDRIFPGVNLEQYQGLWAVEESRFNSMLRHVATLNFIAHLAEHAHDDISAISQRTQSIAEKDIALQVIDIQGTMTKGGSSLSFSGSTVRLRQAVRAAANDPNIHGIMLRIDSPGGTVAGTADLANEVRAAATKKPVHAFVEDFCASAAYWVASSTSWIVANDPTAAVGSIGTFMAMHDLSGMAAKEGIKAVVIRAGAYKGAGFPGTEITDEQKAVWQELVDKTQSQFTAAVAAGRNLSVERVAELADGRVHLAADAKQLGLIDGIESFDTALAALESEARKRFGLTKTARNVSVAGAPFSENEEEPMSEKPVATPAAYDDIVACCVGASSEFVCSQLAKKATLDQAQSSWMEAQQAKIVALQKESADAKAAAAKPGVQTLGGADRKKSNEGDDGGDAVSHWESLIQKNVARGMSLSKAKSVAFKQDPGAHADYIAAYNEIHAGARQR